MKKKKIAIIFGGVSPEYEISLKSAYSIIKNIDDNKYKKILIGISKTGDWYKYEGDIESIKEDKWLEDGICTKVIFSCNTSCKGFIEILNDKINLIKVDAIFPVLHGKNGEDGTIQGMIELAGIPLIGSDLLSSGLCMNKYLSHKLVESYGIKVAKSIVINSEVNKKQLENMIKNLNFPLFIKPMRAGSSFGITKVYDILSIDKAIKEAFLFDTEIIIEENIDGIEIGCAILGNNELEIGEIDEIELSNGFFNFKEKYTLNTSKIHCPARINKELERNVKEVAERIYRILKCKDFARIDMFLTKENEIYFNEVNTIPGFTLHSRYPNMMKKKGIEFDKLVNKIISLEV